MGSQPLNLALRFLLELVAWGAVGLWGWSVTDGALRYLLAMGLPLLVMALWGIFAVPGDRSRSGRAPVPVRLQAIGGFNHGNPQPGENVGNNGPGNLAVLYDEGRGGIFEPFRPQNFLHPAQNRPFWKRLGDKIGCACGKSSFPPLHRIVGSHE